MGVAATGTARANRMENASLRDIVKMSKEKRGSSDVVTDFPSNITAVRWKDNKVVNAVSTLTGKQPIQQVKRYCHHKNRRVNIEQSNIINQYYMSMRRVDRMDQNISTYMITLHTKKWWWPRFRFVVDVTVNNTHQIYLKFHLNLVQYQYRLDGRGLRRVIVDAYYHLYRKNLPSTTLFTGSRSLLHPANNLQFDNINRLPRAHREGVAYQDVKKPRYVITKNAMSAFMLNVLSYITASRAACKV